MKKIKLIIITFLAYWLILFLFIYTKYFYFFDKDYFFSWEKIEKQYFDKLEKEFSFSPQKLYKVYIYKVRYKKYIPYVEKKLKENSIPLDFKYLPIVESSLDPKALSNKWALWLWQFMPETWKRFWLKINDDIDERLDFVKSTDAAIKYIKFLYEKFWNWTLVAAAYNRWENWLFSALESQKKSNYHDLELNSETWRYVYKMIWVKSLFE